MTETVKRVRGPVGVMKSWQPVLEEFARNPEPQTWELENVRMLPVDKFEATMYLVEKGLLEPCGRVRDEHCDTLYRATETGLFMWQTALTELKRRKRPTGVRGEVREPTLAQRTVRVAHTSVFDLATKPWTYSIRAEAIREFGDLA